jgi:hypothetical protein
VACQDGATSAVKGATTCSEWPSLLDVGAAAAGSEGLPASAPGRASPCILLRPPPAPPPPPPLQPAPAALCTTQSPTSAVSVGPGWGLYYLWGHILLGRGRGAARTPSRSAAAQLASLSPETPAAPPGPRPQSCAAYAKALAPRPATSPPPGNTSAPAAPGSSAKTATSAPTTSRWVLSGGGGGGGGGKGGGGKGGGVRLCVCGGDRRRGSRRAQQQGIEPNPRASAPGALSSPPPSFKLRCAPCLPACPPPAPDGLPVVRAPLGRDLLRQVRRRLGRHGVRRLRARPRGPGLRHVQGQL